MSHYTRSSLASRHRHERTCGFGTRGLPTIKITSASGRNKSYDSIKSKIPSIVDLRDHPRAWGDQSRRRQLLHILSSQTLILESAALHLGHSSKFDQSLAHYSSDHTGRSFHQNQLSEFDTTAMTSTTTYDLLWSHQVMLLQEIESMNRQIAATRQSLEHAEHVLSQEGSTRKAKKKSLWVRSTTKHTLRDRERDITVLLHNLNVTQTQIANAHQAAQAFLARGESMPQSPFPSVNGWTAGNGFGVSSNAPFPQHDWTLSRTAAAFQTNANFANMDETLLRPPVGPVLGRRRDSGFDEPPLFAHPFDLDTTMNTGSHVFAHEMMVSPMSTVPVAPLMAPTILAPTPATTASPEPATPTPASGRTTPTLDPTADEFNYAPPVPTVPETKAKRKITFAVDTTLTSGAIAERSPDLDPSAPTFSPTTEAGKQNNNAKHKRRYSEAAISIIENRLRDKNNQQPQAPWGVKKNGGEGNYSKEGSGGAGGNVYRRRGKSIGDVAVQMVYSNNKGMEINEEMVWPLTA